MANSSSSFGRTLLTMTVLGGVGYGGYRFFGKEKPKDPVYLTVSALQQGVIQTVSAGGRLQTERTILIGSQVSGLVTEVNVDFNDVVKEGDILVKIDPTNYEQKLAQA